MVPRLDGRVPRRRALVGAAAVGIPRRLDGVEPVLVPAAALRVVVAPAERLVRMPRVEPGPAAARKRGLELADKGLGGVGVGGGGNGVGEKRARPGKDDDETDENVDEGVDGGDVAGTTGDTIEILD